MSARSEAELMEAAAALEHERWSAWMRHLFDQGVRNADGTFTLPAWAVDRWTRQAETPYANLSEPEKESDRREVRKQLEVVERFRPAP
ncbi:MAG: hypothetical protein KGL39_34935 [Patescibacteria group bacterium]|nr:hypothetical protein [Patescibacteria group bacterium]